MTPSIPFPLSFIALSCGLISFQISADDSTQNAASTTETIQVLGKKHQNTSAPTGKSELIDASDFAPNVANISDLVADTPGAELSGQGGLFQVYSLRGMSRWRVLTHFAGIPIHTERRAGTAASFISPWLMQQVEVIKGPVSTLYGSGGMAGITQITPRLFTGTHIETNIGSDNHSNSINLGWGNDTFSLGLSHRKDEDGYTAKGEQLNNHFQQTSGTFSANWSLTDDIQSQVLLLSSKGDDIGKTNNEDFLNSKYTNYPDETHHILQWGLVAEDDWQARIALHQQSLTTQVIRFDKRINTVENEATDYSLSFTKLWGNDNIDGQWGYEQEYRTGVDAKENETSLTDGEQINYHLLSAEQLNSALFANANFEHDSWSFSTGARLSYINQKSDLASENSSKSDQAVTGFASAAYQLTSDVQLTAAISNGFRFPSVTERYFNGTTARGITLGNVDLEPETARNLELGLVLEQNNLQLQANIFHNRIENYIERVNLDEDTRTYVNLDEGTIKGIELGFSYQVSDTFSYQLSGHSIEGENQDGQTLADITADKLQLGLNYTDNHWGANLSIKHRFAQNDVAPGDQAVGSVDIVKVSFSYDISDSWQVSLWANNLLDKHYLVTHDSKSAYAAERQWGLSLALQLD